VGLLPAGFGLSSGPLIVETSRQLLISGLSETFRRDIVEIGRKKGASGRGQKGRKRK